MENHVVPNYTDLFRKHVTYDEEVAKLSSETIISVCIALINELSSGEEKFALQKRIYEELQKTFSKQQKNWLDLAFKKFIVKTNKKFAGMIFGRRYLLEMILKELKDFRSVAENKTIPAEYTFFRAYLLVIELVNENDNQHINFKKDSVDIGNNRYEILWKPIIPQLEFSERPHLIFESFKLLCFLKFASDKYKTELKSCLSAFHFNSISQLMASFNQVNNCALGEDPKAILKKLSYLLPNPDVDESHLIAQTINKQNIQDFTIRTIRENPLYFKAGRGYMVISPDLYFRKNYFGPFFELYHKTELNKTEKFNQYSINISDALEKNLLKPLLTSIKGQADILHFDDNTKDVPDGYIRIGNIIFLFEYKAYIFDEKLSQYPEVREIKEYIDEKFVRTKKGKKKGVTQLKDQIDILTAGGFPFDQSEIFNEGEDIVRIYPVILHHDFMFSLPGVNHYLDGKFRALLDVNKRFDVMPVTLMNLSVLLDMALGQRDMLFMESMLIEYFNYQQHHQVLLATQPNMNIFLSAHISFDEFFQMFFVQHTTTPKDGQKETLTNLLKLAGISIDEFQNPL